MKMLFAFVATVALVLSWTVIPASAQKNIANATNDVALSAKVAVLSAQVQQMQQGEASSSVEVADLKAQVAGRQQTEKSSGGKTTADYLIALAPPAITVVGTFFVALFATGRIEKQKQRMELYKSLYNERIGAAQLLAKSSGVVVNRMKKHLSGQGRSGDYEGYLEELIDHHNSYDWLFSEDVNNRVDSLIAFIKSKTPWQQSHQQNIEPEIEKAEALLTDLNKSISQMMKNDTLERLVGR